MATPSSRKNGLGPPSTPTPSEWKKVEDDCRMALQLDKFSVKAHYMLGLALLDRQEFAEGIKELEKSLELGRGANPASYMVEEIWQELAKAKYTEWERSSKKRATRLHELEKACEEALKNYHGLDGSTEDEHEEQLIHLKEVFRKADDIPKEVPDHLCCKITLDIFRDPVITPTGVTYERSVLLDHLQKVGKFDPITREPLAPHQLVPNLAIKEAVQAFLNEHGWAYRMS
ncbi:E3 ubiquitin-protein ligase CHIP-like isoform X2 [Typha latifolia]|uniref:E3 ubiquitin-protein ligase CHIP-like isoform X2 n=1 Tax=Typha latifolia TaxID=4733 RepID=UPI003C2DA3C9